MSGFINIPNECPPVVKHINEQLKIRISDGTLNIPDFTNAKSIFSVSDYAGENGVGYFQAISYLIFDWNNAGEWNAARTIFREERLDFIRTFEFKKLNQDRERQRLLSDFLRTYDAINGLSLTYLIHKDIKYLFSDKSPHTILKEEGLGEWKPHIAEKLLRVLHLQAPIVAGLTNENHKYLLYTDRDAITKDIEALGELTRRIFNIYSNHGFETIGYGIPFENPQMEFDDLLSLPDLVAGALLEYLNSITDVKTKGTKLLIQQKSDDILKWFANNDSMLKKIVCVMQPSDQNRQIKFQFLTFKPER